MAFCWLFFCCSKRISTNIYGHFELFLFSAFKNHTCSRSRRDPDVTQITLTQSAVCWKRRVAKAANPPVEFFTQNTAATPPKLKPLSIAKRLRQSRDHRCAAESQPEGQNYLCSVDKQTAKLLPSQT